ncbi:MAG: hypothetical protein D6702_05270 [Planctomycetota bacterium]|nr:MAG: hypothetical protein D6702_05270 [Planctomycetota bacterium]
MERRPARIAGLLAGWSLGAWEAGLVLSNAQFAGTYWVYLLTPMVAMALYGWGGWLIGRLSPVAPPWWLLLPVGAAIILYLNRGLGLPAAAGWPWTAAGAVAALALAVLALFGRAERLPKALGLASLSLPLVLGLLFILIGQDPVVRAAARGPERPDAPNVVLVTWDTVRADTLPLYGGGGLDLPVLERLAAEGVVLEDFRSVASITAPAHASMLTGLYPPSHGLRANGESLVTEGLPSLPAVLSAAGYATGAFVSGYPIRAKFGFATGFQYFDGRSDADFVDTVVELCRFSSCVLRRVLPERARSRFTVPGDLTVQRATQWYLEQDGPTFLWVHLFDAHSPYLPPEVFRRLALARADEGPHAVLPELEEALVLQRGEIIWLDALLGELRVALEARDPGLRNTLVMLVADHGECFGEGGPQMNHEASLFAATQHVPAVIRLPGSMPQARRGERLRVPASHVDLAPTILDLLGLPPLPDAQGRSLLPILLGEPEESLPDLGRYMEAYQVRLGDKRLSGWVKDGWKVVWALDGEVALYRLDRGDVDLSREYPDRLAELLAEGKAFLERLPRRESGGMDLDFQDRHALEHLGYVDSARGD